MQKLIIILLVFIAIFTYIRVFDTAEATEKSQEIPVEIVQ